MCDLQHKEARGPRPVCALLLEKLATAEAEVAQLIQNPGQAGGHDNRSSRADASTRLLDHAVRVVTTLTRAAAACYAVTSSSAAHSCLLFTRSIEAGYTEAQCIECQHC